MIVLLPLFIRNFDFYLLGLATSAHLIKSRLWKFQANSESHPTFRMAHRFIQHDLDPLNLRSKLTPPSPSHSSRVRKFYKAQNNLINTLISPDSKRDIPGSNTKREMEIATAVYGSLCANIVLFGIQIFASLSYFIPWLNEVELDLYPCMRLSRMHSLISCPISFL
jgi:hypothetical protein